MENEFNKGSELDKQIYAEGEGTWGLKSGFLDVEDVKEFIRLLKEEINNSSVGFTRDLIIRELDKLAGKDLI
jgi:hypothetical protein